MRKLTFVDFFAGCGGFSLGMMNAGFKHFFAVERSPMAAETYYRNIIAKKPYDPTLWKNHIVLDKQNMIEAGLYVGDVENIHTDDTVTTYLRNKNVDVVVGGPPCQGFSMVGKRNPDDIRNTYPFKFFDLVHKIKPKAFVMENVIGISLNFKKHKEEVPLDLICESFKSEFNIIRTQLNANHFGVPQRRQRIIVIGIRKEICRKLGFGEHDSKYEDVIWGSDFIDNLEHIPLLAPRPIHSSEKDKLRLNDALIDLGDSGYTTNGTSNYSMAMRGIWDEKPANHILRQHGPLTTYRFSLLHEIMKITNEIEVTNNLEKNLTYLCLLLEGKKIYMPDGTCIYDQKTLEEAIKKISTKKHSQRLLDGNKESPTILTIPDDYIHYKFPRVLTVREMARIQSFPDDFVFMGKETTGGKKRRNETPQYSQVGNAVPPLLARAIGDRLHTLLSQ